MTRALLLEDLRRRIERLESRPAAPTGPRLPPGPIYPRAPRRLGDLRDAEVAPWGARIVRRLEPGARVGAVALADAARPHDAVAAALIGGAPAPGGDGDGLCAGLRIVDIETTGLSGGTGTLAFLVGVGRFADGGAFVVDQLVLGSPAEEAGFLEALLASLAGATMIVTFNGRSFDVPLLRTRCVLSCMPFGPLATLPHLDLIAPARRLWRGGDCRLVALEERVLSRRRPEDVPGLLAPAAYAAFLRDGDAAPIAAVLAHNRDDVCGTAALLAVTLRILAEPLQWAEDAGELLGAALHHARVRGAAAALPLVARALELARARELRRRALLLQARLQRRVGALPSVRATWERYRAEFPDENRGHMELAKILEHRVRDLDGALAATLAAPHAAAEDAQRRAARLRRRITGRAAPRSSTTRRAWPAPPAIDPPP